MASIKSARQFNMKGIQASLDEAQLEVSASEYVKRSLTLGIPGGNWPVCHDWLHYHDRRRHPPFGGFMLTWTKLEQERDRKQVRYTKQLASACDTIRTAYGVDPRSRKPWKP